MRIKGERVQAEVHGVLGAGDDLIEDLKSSAPEIKIQVASLSLQD